MVNGAVAPPPQLWERGFLGFMRRHQVLFLLMLSPGISEYVSGSSPLQAIVVNPPLFIIQIAANLGLYGPGVLLTREALVRWRKGWATAILLGVAYGILEEGVALGTLFNPKAMQVGILGSYGHWFGVDWVWTAGVLPGQIAYSIFVPILLLGLTYPETKGRSLIGRRGVAAAFGILAVDVSAIVAFGMFHDHYSIGLGLMLISLATIALLAYSARRVRADWPLVRDGPKHGLKTTFVAGLLFYPGILGVQAIGAFGHLPALVDLVAVILVGSVLFLFAAHNLSFPGNQSFSLSFALGLTLPIVGLGLLTQFPLVLVVDVPLLLLFVRLIRVYRASRRGTQ